MVYLVNVATARPLKTLIREDNNQVLSAARKGCSPALRHLARTQRVSLGFVHEVLHGPDKVQGLELVREESVTQKADFFTKQLQNNNFLKGRDMLNLKNLVDLPEVLRLEIHRMLSQQASHNKLAQAAPS